MDISIKEVKQYIHCPYYYRFNTKTNVPLLKIHAKEHWGNCIKYVLAQIMKRWLDNNYPTSLVEAQALWNKAWYEDPMALDYPKGSNHRDLGNDGWIIINNFYTLMSTPEYSMIAADHNEHRIVAVDYEYTLPVKNTKYRLTGTIDLLLTDSTPNLNYRGLSQNYIGIKFVTSEYHMTKMVGHNDIEMTAYRRAIRKLILDDADSTSLVEPKLFYFLLDPATKNFTTTKRFNSQLEVLDETVLSIAKSIENEIYYPSYSNQCDNCYYLGLCNKGKWVKETNLYRYPRSK